MTRDVGGSTNFKVAWQEKWGFLGVERADYIPCNQIRGERLTPQILKSIPGTSDSRVDLSEALGGCPDTSVHFISHFG